MEAAVALVSFFGLAGFVQGLGFLYNFTTNLMECTEDICDMKNDLDLVDDLVRQVFRECNERDGPLRGSAALECAIGQAQKSVEDINKELSAYPMNGIRCRFWFAAKFSKRQKLRGRLDRTKTLMLEFKNQLQSDLLYEIRDINHGFVRSVEKTGTKLTSNVRDFRKVTQKSKVHTETRKDSAGRVGAPVQLASDTSLQDLTDNKNVAKKLEHNTDMLTETRTTSSATSSPKTPVLMREVNDTSIIDSPQQTIASSISSTRSMSQSISQDPKGAGAASKYPLLQFKDNQFQFLIAIIFTQRTSNKSLACQRASECLAAYPTPEALSEALPKDLSQYFECLGFQEVKPRYLIKLAQTYVKDPPEHGRLRSKAKCPRSEISHLPQIGPLSITAWLVYCCGRTDIATQDETLLEYMKYLKIETRAICF